MHLKKALCRGYRRWIPLTYVPRICISPLCRDGVHAYRMKEHSVYARIRNNNIYSRHTKAPELIKTLFIFFTVFHTLHVVHKLRLHICISMHVQTSATNYSFFLLNNNTRYYWKLYLQLEHLFFWIIKAILLSFLIEKFKSEFGIFCRAVTLNLNL